MVRLLANDGGLATCFWKSLNQEFHVEFLPDFGIVQP